MKLAIIFLVLVFCKVNSYDSVNEFLQAKEQFTMNLAAKTAALWGARCVDTIRSCTDCTYDSCGGNMPEVSCMPDFPTS